MSGEQTARTEAILRGEQASATEMLELARHHKKKDEFRLAQRLLALARQQREAQQDADLRRELAQEHALCTYKDPDLIPDEKLDWALEILREGDNLKETQDQESLGLAGAIYRRKWEVDGRTEYLAHSVHYYLRGYQLNPIAKQGYTSINAAFLLDLLADTEVVPPAGLLRPELSQGTQQRALAQEIRQRLIEDLPRCAQDEKGSPLAKDYWFLVTVAQAYFGNRHYQEAEPWLLRARAIPNVPEWEYETTARQLATLARLHGVNPLEEGAEQQPAWVALQSFLGSHAAAARTAFIGKVGLALSGGGFRASLYHLGVLARLAELDILRHVEVLSCVSGGSIVGAHYYLELRNLLQTKEESEINRDDYVKLVQRLISDFLEGVQRNIRTRVAGDLLSNLKMIFQPRYSRTARVGELFERELYARVRDGEGKEPRWISGLFIRPKGEGTFEPKRHNWRRKDKVPILILNATTLNTGHVWQFTASYMGEPPGCIDPEVDGNRRLRRMYYETQAPVRHKKVRLGHAVAASACVPGLFEPLVLEGLYPGMTVRLVDGGVHDNQGVQSLIDQGCSVQLVSDGSGQMAVEENARAGLVAVPVRTNSILMARVREAQFKELESRRRSRVLRDAVSVHLKKDLDEDPTDWVDCQDPHDLSRSARPAVRRTPFTRYGILKGVQRRLADIRTDLDSFSDAEAFALMTSGYRMMELALKHRGQMLPRSKEPALEWEFLKIEPPMKLLDAPEAAHPRLMSLLGVGSNTAFKVWRLYPALRVMGFVLLSLLAAGLLWLGWRYWNTPFPTLTVQRIFLLLLPVLVGAVLGKFFVRLIWLQNTLQRIAIGVGMAAVGWLLARVHLHVFDRLYLRHGRLKRFR
ncbi:patatin-like phospholipase family protein [Pyxidicoccus caerfyrddinensis]|uniref:patatin-like phospholipase family protein n=1 Tax=Pyxidicoccus caerfyrddinensis TaxID=2709663 RepID=UPI0013D990CD|nr:patatin-like phospholipase family protein [Pyxidicoccus caerfyrddinensis]